MLVNNILYSSVHGIYQFPDAECCSGEIRGQLIFFFFLLGILYVE